MRPKHIAITIIILGLMAWGVITLYNDVYNAWLATVCKANIAQLAKAVMLYQEDFGTHPLLRNPDFFTAIYNSGILKEPVCYRCPASDEPWKTEQMFRDNNSCVTDYECRTLPPNPKLSPVLFFWEKKPFHAQGRFVVFGRYMSGQKRKKLEGWYLDVECISESKFAELVKEARK